MRHALPELTEFCELECVERVLHVTLARPERHNALHPPAHRELAAVFDAFAADPELWVAILTGAGERAFCAGADLKWLAEGGGAALPPTEFGGLTARYDLDKPVIAAVNGIAFGGGFELALACDVIVASEHARFALPEPKVGVAAVYGGLHRVVRQLPQKLAMGLLLTGATLDAAEAERHGLVNQVVPHDALGAAARRWADAMLACAPLAVRASKAAALRGLDAPSLQAAMAGPHPELERALRSADAREGPRAFAEKRTPRWTGS